MSDLYDKLAEAYARPSGAYRTFQTAADIPQKALEGYLAGSQVADSIRERKNKQRTLTDILGGTMPAGTEGYGNLTAEQFKPTAEILSGIGAIDKANKSGAPKVSDFVSQDQALKALTGVQGKTTPEDQAFLSAFPPGQIPRQDFATYFNGKTNKQTANSRSDIAGANVGRINLQQLPSELGPNTGAGAAYGVKIAARQGKSIIAKPGSAQRMSLASGDIARAVIRAAPQLDAQRGADFSQNLATKISSISQRITSNPNGPDAPKLRKEMYDILDDLDKSATPFIANHLQNYEDLLGSLPAGVKQRELGETLPDVPFDAGGPVQQKTYQKTGTGPNGIKIGTNDNWATWEPIQ